ncbi:MAG: Hsp33 family molecular chaperone HslO [Pseudomonadota bacterium]
MKETSHATLASDDCSRRYLFDDADVRGETVHLDRAFRDITDLHEYAPGVRQLMGQFLAASVLLSTNLKFEGRLILQARSSGQIPLLMVECNHLLEIRAIARGAEEATSEDFNVLLADGQLAITIDPLDGQRYQGIVPLVDGSLARSIDAYFQHSEQLNTRLWLAADGERAAGMLLQQLPAQLTPDTEARERQWQRLVTLAETVEGKELLNLPADHLLYRLFHEDHVRLLDAQGVRFHCSCSKQRTLRALSTLDPMEIEDILQEQGAVTMDCEFCNQQYRFEREDLAELLGRRPENTLH